MKNRSLVCILALVTIGALNGSAQRPILTSGSKASPAIQLRKPSPSDERTLRSRWADVPVMSSFLGTGVKMRSADVSTLIREGLKYYELRQFDEALIKFRDAEKLDPENSYIQSLIGSTLAELERFDQAVTSFRKATQLDPKSGAAFFGLCQSLKLSGKHVEAVEECRKAVELDPDASLFSIYLANLIVDDRTFEAIELLNSNLDDLPDSIWQQGTIGDLYFRAGDYQQALAVYENIALKWPKVPTVYIRLSSVYDYLDRQTEAINAARKYAEYLPSDADAQINLGEKLQNAGLFEESVVPLLKATSIDPAYGQAYLSLSESYEALGDQQNTIQSLAHAYKYLPPSFWVAYKYGSALTTYGKMAEAVAPLERAYSLEPDLHNVMSALGLAYFESNQFDKAIEVLTKADRIQPNDYTIEMFLRVAKGRKQILSEFDYTLGYVKEYPDDIKARTYLGNAYRYQGNLKEAERQYLEVIKLSAKDSKGYAWLAIFYGDTGQLEKSLEYFQKAVEIRPNPVDYLSLAETLNRLGRLDQAIDAAKKAVEIKSFKEGRATLGELFLRKGKRAEAMAEFQAAFALAPEHAETNFHLAWLYLRMGDKQGALRHYQILKVVDPTQLKFLERALRANFGPLP